MSRDDWPSWPPDDPAILKSVSDVMSSGQWGKYHSAIADQLTQRIAGIHQMPHVRLTCSGTMAIELALRAADVGRSGAANRVILAAYDYPGNFRTVECLGGRPVLVDVEGNRPVMSVEELLKVGQSIDPESIAAVIVSHLYGHIADMTRIADFCLQHGWLLIEDACQTPAGMTPDGRLVGTLGDFSTLSFGGSKPITGGSGGALLTRSDRLAARIDQLVDRPGDATAMSPLACAAVLPQWSTIDRDHQRRQAAATQLQRFDWASINCRVMDDYLSGGTLSIYKFPFFASSADHRQQLIARLDALGLPIGLGFRSLHRISSRRADRIGSLLSSKQFGECCVLIDHRVLLADDAVARVQRLVQQV